MKNILMNREMTKAILDGRKTQTRRVVKADPIIYDNPVLLEPDSCVKFNFSAGGCQNYSATPLFVNPKYQKGDIVWVREPASVDFITIHDEMGFHYLSDNKTAKIKFPERLFNQNEDTNFLPKWAFLCQGVPNGCIKEMARCFIKIIDVRVEKLQNIKPIDICKEGCSLTKTRNPLEDINTDYNKVYKWFINLWNKTAPKGYKWEDDPYVFVYEFKRVNKDGSEL